MEEPQVKLVKTLARHRLSNTAARTTVFTALLEHGPVTLAELIRYCEASIDRASVYRTTALFESIGVVQRLQIGWKYRLELSDDFQHHHHHLHCLSCGTVTAMPEDPALENRLKAAAKAKGFLPQDHQVEIRGLCANCQAA